MPLKFLHVITDFGDEKLTKDKKPWLNVRRAHKLTPSAFHSLYIAFSFCGFISITARNFWTTPILWKLLPQFQMVVHVTSGEPPATM